ncbi:MAG: beta galactosidase jelly roll domain-containing protein [Anaerolineae bacterium]|nr:beta galactosidase jelly roll domain-containing protein [Anaerolineae bacterium]
MTTLPRPEYPRPQFVRREWLNLNGSWEFEFDDRDRGLHEAWYVSNRAFTQQIVVPFPYQSELSGIHDPTFHDVVWYRRSFDLPQAWESQCIRLHFGAVDYRATVWLNGEFVTEHEGGHTPFTAEINALPGVNYLRIVPNAGHSLNADALTGAINFEKAVINGVSLPIFDWNVIDAGSTIVLNSITHPTSVKLWTSHNPLNRDFRIDTVGTHWESTTLPDLGGGTFSGHVEPPEDGATAFFIEMSYVVNGIPLVFTTEARTLPLFTPEVIVTHPDSPYTGNPSPASAQVNRVGGGTVRMRRGFPR